MKKILIAGLLTWIMLLPGISLAQGPLGLNVADLASNPGVWLVGGMMGAVLTFSLDDPDDAAEVGAIIVNGKVYTAKADGSDIEQMLDTIKFYNPEISDEDIKQAARTAFSGNSSVTSRIASHSISTDADTQVYAQSGTDPQVTRTRAQVQSANAGSGGGGGGGGDVSASDIGAAQGI